MPKSWYIVMIILGIILFIVCVINCKMFCRDYKKIQELVEPVRSNRIYPMPVAIGVEVYGPQRGVQVITVENV
tara:strand:- start:463 stop:681 length:219 start_codon:yes stop_codon:yes gene_type:complete